MVPESDREPPGRGPGRGQGNGSWSGLSFPEGPEWCRPGRRQFLGPGKGREWYSGGVNRVWYLMLWVFEVVAVVGLVLALVLPIQDYSLKGYLEWQQHPSPETYKTFLEKQRQERAARLVIAVPFAATAVLLTGPLRRYRLKSR
jgi:hypothetical protein